MSRVQLQQISRTPAASEYCCCIITSALLLVHHCCHVKVGTHHIVSWPFPGLVVCGVAMVMYTWLPGSMSSTWIPLTFPKIEQVNMLEHVLSPAVELKDHRVSHLVGEATPCSWDDRFKLHSSRTFHRVQHCWQCPVVSIYGGVPYI